MWDITQLNKSCLPSLNIKILSNEFIEVGIDSVSLVRVIINSPLVFFCCFICSGGEWGEAVFSVCAFLTHQ